MKKINALLTFLFIIKLFIATNVIAHQDSENTHPHDISFARPQRAIATDTDYQLVRAVNDNHAITRIQALFFNATSYGIHYALESAAATGRNDVINLFLSNQNDQRILPAMVHNALLMATSQHNTEIITALTQWINSHENQ